MKRSAFEQSNHGQRLGGRADESLLKEEMNPCEPYQCDPNKDGREFGYTYKT